MKVEEMDLILKRKEMSKESWIKNVMRIYPDRTREEAEDLYHKLFDAEESKGNHPVKTTT